MVAVPPAFSQTSGEMVVSISCISSEKFAMDAPPSTLPGLLGFIASPPSIESPAFMVFAPGDIPAN